MTTSIEYIPQIQSHLDAIAKAEDDALGFALRCGLAFASGKAALKIELPKAASSDSTFGKYWEGWLTANFGIGRSTADVYIRHCLFDRKSIQSVVCLVASSSDHPCILALVEGGGPKFIARSLAIPLRKFVLKILGASPKS